MVEVYILPKLTQTLLGYIDFLSLSTDCLATSHQYYQLSPPVAIMALWDSFEMHYRGIFNVFVVSGMGIRSGTLLLCDAVHMQLFWCIRLMF